MKGSRTNERCSRTIGPSSRTSEQC